MGGVLSWCCGEDTDSELGDVNERTRLISDHSPQQTHIPELIQDQARNLPFSCSLPKVNEETKALQNILQDAAGNVIDIGAIDHLPVLEQNDYIERSALYGKRLTAVGASLAARHARPVHTANTEDVTKTLSEEPIQQEDLELITEMAMRAEKECAHFKIKHEEDLVVSFGERQ